MARDAIHILRNLTDFLRPHSRSSGPITSDLIEEADSFCTVTGASTPLERHVSAGNPEAHTLTARLIQIMTIFVDFVKREGELDTHGLFEMEEGFYFIPESSTFEGTVVPLDEGELRLLAEAGGFFEPRSHESASLFERTVLAGANHPFSSQHDDALRAIRLAHSYYQQIQEALSRRGLLESATEKAGSGLSLLAPSDSGNKRVQLFSRSVLEDLLEVPSKDFPKRMRKCRLALVELLTPLRHVNSKNAKK